MFNQVKEKIHEVISNKIRFATKITNETNLIEDLGFTSIDLMEMIYQLEEIFDIQFSFDDLEVENITVVESLIKLVTSKIDGAK